MAISFRVVNSSNVFSIVLVSVSSLEMPLTENTCIHDKEVLLLVLSDMADTSKEKACDGILNHKL